jgi:hypothetical protein
MSNGKQKKRQPGRPKVITPEVEVKLLRLISEGYTKTRACKKLGIGTTTVDEKDEGDRQFAASLARARVRGAWARNDFANDETRAMYELAKAGKASHECIAAVRELLHQARWESSKLIPRTFGDRMGVDVGGAIHHSHDIDAMSMMEKARAIAYAMSKAKKLEALPASNAQASNAQVSNALPVAPLTRRPPGDGGAASLANPARGARGARP